MRAPPEVPYLFAMESAVDELAYALGSIRSSCAGATTRGSNPVSGGHSQPRADALLRRGGARPSAGTSAPRRRARCARANGWSATAAPPRPIRRRSARRIAGSTLLPDGRVRIEIGTHDIGTAAYTILAQTAAERLGLPIEQVEVRLGDSAAAGRAAHRRLDLRPPATATPWRRPATCLPRKRAAHGDGRRLEPLAVEQTFKPRGALPLLAVPDPARPPMFAGAARGQAGPSSPPARTSSRCTSTSTPARCGCRAWSAPSPPARSSIR